MCFTMHLYQKHCLGACVIIYFRKKLFPFFKHKTIKFLFEVFVTFYTFRKHFTLEYLLCHYDTTHQNINEILYVCAADVNACVLPFCINKYVFIGVFHQRKHKNISLNTNTHNLITYSYTHFDISVYTPLLFSLFAL